MESLWLYFLGFLGQALFGSRLIVQLFQSEKAGKVVSPVAFWYLSLAGSFIFMVYGIFRQDLVIIGGQFLSYFIYIRNLQLKDAWTFPNGAKAIILTLPLLATGGFFLYGDTSIALDVGILLHPVMLMGVIGQLALNLRFVYQWYYSEKQQSSILPVGFWQISVWASVLVIIYSLFHPVHKIDVVLLVSQTMGITVYARNLWIYRRSRRNAVQTVV